MEIRARRRNGMRRRLLLGTLGAAFSMGVARTALASCWEESGGVMCAVCSSNWCCVTWFANGTCCNPTIEHCEAV